MRKTFYPREHANILVAGDVMLDRYVFGSAGRISPEAPVPVVGVDRVEERPGGAANVAANISCLGVRVTLAGITGDDGQAGVLESALAESGVCYRCYRLPGASTITKLRVLSQNRLLSDWHAGGDIQYIDFPEELSDAYQSFTESDISALREAGYRKPFTGLEPGIRKYLEHIEAEYGDRF